MFSPKLIQEKEYIQSDLPELILNIPVYLKFPQSYKPIVQFEIQERVQQVLSQQGKLSLSNIVNSHARAFIHMQIENLKDFNQLTESMKANAINFIFYNAPNYSPKNCTRYYNLYLKNNSF